MRRPRPYATLAVAATIAAGAGVAIAASVQTGDDAGDSSRPPAAPASRSERDSRCPAALPGGPRAMVHVGRTVRRQLPRVLGGIDPRGATITGAFDLQLAAFLPGLRRGRYEKPAARACGVAIARRSWMVVVNAPRARMASLVPAIVYVARTRDGWRPWYRHFPNFGTAEFIDP